MTTEKQKPSKFNKTIITIGIILVLVVIAGKGKWVLFYDTSIAGSVVDADTGKPLEKVIVVGLWQLSQVLGQGFGGYSKVLLVEADKEGKFTLPWWFTFKPWTFWSTTRDGAPQIIIYKPGYKLLYTGRDAWTDYDKVQHLSDAEIAQAKKQQENFGINPARLRRVLTDSEVWSNHEDFRSFSHYPDKYYSKQQLTKLLIAIENNTNELSNQYGRSKTMIFHDVEADRKYWVEGKR